jgi:hypothetical protein
MAAHVGEKLDPLAAKQLQENFGRARGMADRPDDGRGDLIRKTVRPQHCFAFLRGQMLRDTNGLPPIARADDGHPKFQLEFMSLCRYLAGV